MSIDTLTDEFSRMLDAETADRPSTILTSVLDQLRGEAEAETITLEIRNRPGWSAEYRPSFTTAEIQKMTKACELRGKDQFDPVKLAALVVLRANTAVFVNGQIVLDDDGATPITFMSPRFRDLYRVPDAWQAMRPLFGGKAGEPDLLAHSRALTADWERDATSS